MIKTILLFIYNRAKEQNRWKSIPIVVPTAKVMDDMMGMVENCFNQSFKICVLKVEAIGQKLWIEDME